MQDRLVKIEEDLVELKSQIKEVMTTLQGDLFNTEKRIKVMLSKIENSVNTTKELLEK
tara:strand:- start:1784 stop:1957 length:174 start_codon:yes stop_codon:yes gene_type:complete